MILTPSGMQILLYSGMRILLYSFEKFEAVIDLEVHHALLPPPTPTCPWKLP